ncbi:MAG: Lhr family helicase, partial [Acidimicrobiales bacterium]
LVGLENEGFAIRGRFTHNDPAGPEEWCSRRLLSRMHGYSQKGKRARVNTATAQDFMRFLLEWHHVAPGSQLDGADGLTNVVAQLQGWHAAAAVWEPEILSSRLRNHSPDLLDRRSLAGEITWGRMAVGCRASESTTRQTATKTTPITLALRADVDWLVSAARGASPEADPPENAEAEAGCAAELLDELRNRGARFHHELRQATGRLATDVEQGLWELVWRGEIHADSFHAVRSLFDARDRGATQQRVGSGRGLRRGSAARGGGEGRWTLFAENPVTADADELAEAVAEQLLARWGVVFHDLVAREQLALPWREIQWALRRLEARGLIRGGRFVSGFGGEQYALPEASDHLARVARTERGGVEVRVNACDPLNLTGVVTPGERVPSRRSLTVTYRDGLPV